MRPISLLLLAERLHDPDSVHVLVDDLGDLAFLLLPVPGRREHLQTHPVGDDEQGRHDDEADERKQR